MSIENAKTRCSDGEVQLIHEGTAIERQDCLCRYDHHGRLCSEARNICPYIFYLIPFPGFCSFSDKYSVAGFAWMYFFGTCFLTLLLAWRQSGQSRLIIAPFVDEKPFVFFLEKSRRLLVFDEDEMAQLKKLDKVLMKLNHKRNASPADADWDSLRSDFKQGYYNNCLQNNDF
uniref:EGF-like domain-containing protein n=1 Tax=Rhabditophanes sp. KR3021 TaxID=114890 RepID=A0AC35UEZ2_9BILA